MGVRIVHDGEGVLGGEVAPGTILVYLGKAGLDGASVDANNEGARELKSSRRSDTHDQANKRRSAPETV